ncbi:hypothetical protein FOMG_16186 [Fusarium oxysporum f. sp. melonis 26406]|uniref:Uncharacterized protein n=2 Tax=Fusarium oxysporum TaxID=5507 RepID=W9ZGG5_FUSOX|nr:hypothetical protein FOMG_16186 [Fusarium oxysporum f. sp. melonis 26406]
MLDSVNRVMGLTVTDWDIQYKTTARRISEGREEMKEEKISGTAKAIFGQIFNTSSENGDFTRTQRVDNEILSLPEEATQRAVNIVQRG